MCCLKIDTETLLANCLNTCKTYSFSPDDLQQIVRLMANATDRYIFSDTGDDALHEIVTKFPDMFVYADEDRIALRSEWQHDDKKLPMAYFDFGYSAADIKQLCAAAKKHCTTQNEQLPSCANRVEQVLYDRFVRNGTTYFFAATSTYPKKELQVPLAHPCGLRYTIYGIKKNHLLRGLR